VAFEALAARLATSPSASADLREAARLRLFDTLFATLVGRGLPESASLAVIPLKDNGRLRVLTAATRATEIDDIAISGCVTPGSVVVPAALHLAARSGAGAAAVLDAMVVGYEAIIAFAEAIGGATAIYRGVWPTLTAAPVGVAAVAARLQSFDAGRMRAAMGFAAGRSCGRFDRTLPRWLSLGQAAADGALAAETVTAGFDPPGKTLAAWSELAGITLSPDGFAARVRPRLLDVDTKPFPTARQGLASIEAFSRLQAEQPLGDEDRIFIGAPAAYRDMIGKTEAPDGRLPSVVSAAYQMALIACAPNAIDDAVRDPPMASSAISAFLRRVSIETDPALDVAFPAAWGGRVRIETAGGGPVREAIVLEPRGCAARAFDWADLEEKAARLGQANGIDLAVVHALRDAVKADAPPEVLLDLVMR
jgi:2-methylcitrate dehydratase PrpD